MQDYHGSSRSMGAVVVCCLCVLVLLVAPLDCSVLPFGMSSQSASGGLQALKTPPILKDEESYLEWKEDLAVWELFTVYLTLFGHARDCVRGLDPEQIGSVNGVKLIVERLDTVSKG